MRGLDFDYLIKFGELEYMKQLAQGQLYFNIPKNFKEQENQKGDSSQGDRLEGGHSFKATHRTTVTATDYETEVDITEELFGSSSLKPGTTFNVHFDSLENLPIYCLMAVKEPEVKYHKKTHSIEITPKILNYIKENFPQADTIALIENPQAFIDDIEKSVKDLGSNLKSGLVRYFDYDCELDNTERSKFIFAVDELAPGKEYNHSEQDVWKNLLSKRKSYAPQKEYRLIITDAFIHRPVKIYLPQNANRKWSVRLCNFSNRNGNDVTTVLTRNFESCFGTNYLVCTEHEMDVLSIETINKNNEVKWIKFIHESFRERPNEAEQISVQKGLRNYVQTLTYTYAVFPDNKRKILIKADGLGYCSVPVKNRITKPFSPPFDNPLPAPLALTLVCLIFF